LKIILAYQNFNETKYKLIIKRKIVLKVLKLYYRSKVRQGFRRNPQEMGFIDSISEARNIYDEGLGFNVF